MSASNKSMKCWLKEINESVKNPERFNEIIEDLLDEIDENVKDEKKCEEINKCYTKALISSFGSNWTRRRSFYKNVFCEIMELENVQEEMDDYVESFGEVCEKPVDSISKYVSWIYSSKESDFREQIAQKYGSTNFNEMVKQIDAREEERVRLLHDVVYVGGEAENPERIKGTDYYTIFVKNNALKKVLRIRTGKSYNYSVRDLLCPFVQEDYAEYPWIEEFCFRDCSFESFIPLSPLKYFVRKLEEKFLFSVGDAVVLEKKDLLEFLESSKN